MTRSRERRANPRVVCSAPGWVIFDDSLPVECTVLDLSVSGARLKMRYAANLRSGMALRIPSKGIEQRIEVIWRSGDQAGVIFRMNILGSEDAIVPRPKAGRKPIPVAHLRKIALESHQMPECGGREAAATFGQIAYARCLLAGAITGAGAAANILFILGRF